MTEVNPLLNKTAAGLMAQKLDAADGTKDGKINASIWNEFVKDKGGKEVREFINVEAAMNSITTYVVRESKKAAKSVESLAKEWNENINTPAPSGVAGTTPAAEGVEGGAGTTPTPAAEGVEGGTGTTPAPSAEGAEPDAAETSSVSNAEQVEADFNSVKVTVPKKEVKTTVPADLEAKALQINNAKAEGKAVAEKIKAANAKCVIPFGPGEVDNMEEALKLITKDNVVYVLENIPNLVDMIDGIDAFGYGFNKDEVIKYVLTPLGLKGDEHGWGIYKDGKRTQLQSEYYDKYASGWSLEEIKADIDRISKDIRAKEQATVEEYDKKAVEYNKELEEVKKYNESELPKIQKTFDDANRFLAEVANMEPKPSIMSWHDSEKDCDVKWMMLPDSRWIRVYYDENGEISDILISYDTKEVVGRYVLLNDVIYTKDQAKYSTDKNSKDWDGAITSGYDFEQLKALAEKIFGKNE